MGQSSFKDIVFPSLLITTFFLLVLKKNSRLTVNENKINSGMKVENQG